MGQVGADAHAVRRKLDRVLQEVPEVVIVKQEIYSEAVRLDLVAVDGEIGVRVHKDAVTSPVQKCVADLVGTDKPGLVLVQSAVDVNDRTALYILVKAPDALQGGADDQVPQISGQAKGVACMEFAHQGIRYALLVHSITPSCTCWG